MIISKIHHLEWHNNLRSDFGLLQGKRNSWALILSNFLKTSFFYGNRLPHYPTFLRVKAITYLAIASYLV